MSDIVLATEEDERARTWLDALDRWLAEYPSRQTRATYLEGWREFVAWSHAPPWAVTRQMVLEWRDELGRRGRAPNGIHIRIVALSSFYGFAVAEGLCARNPCYRIRLPQAEPWQDPDHLTEAEARAVLAAPDRTHPVGRRDYALLLMLVTVGLRSGEVRALRVRNVVEAAGGGFLRFVGKGGREAVMPLSEAILVALRAMLDDRLAIHQDDYLFIAAHQYGGERPLSASGVTAILGHITEETIGRRVGCHAMRRTCGTLLYEQTKDVYQVSHHLRHTSLETTQRYVLAMDKARQASAATLGRVLTDPAEKRGG
jgi:site-specific recombinase XerD